MFFFVSRMYTKVVLHKQTPSGFLKNPEVVQVRFCRLSFCFLFVYFCFIYFFGRIGSRTQINLVKFSP